MIKVNPFSQTQSSNRKTFPERGDDFFLCLWEKNEKRIYSLYSNDEQNEKLCHGVMGYKWEKDYMERKIKRRNGGVTLISMIVFLNSNICCICSTSVWVEYFRWPIALTQYTPFPSAACARFSIWILTHKLTYRDIFSHSQSLLRIHSIYIYSTKWLN